MNTIDPMDHKGLVYMVLNTHTWLYGPRSSWTYDDAYQEGMLALIEALQTFDSDEGTVATYCLSRIKWSLYKAHRAQNGLIRKPNDLYTLQSQYKRIQLDYLQSCNREPDNKYMAAQMKMTLSELQHFLDLFAPVQSLNAPLSDADDVTLEDVIQDERDHFEAIEIRLHMAQLRKDLQKMMDERLTATDQKMIKEYYAWNGGKQITIKALAEKYNFSLQVTRGKLQKALTKFNKYRPELVRNYPDIIMSQIYSQNRLNLGDLKRMSCDMLQTYLHIGDLVQVNQSYGVVMGIDLEDRSFEFRSAGRSITLPFKHVIDFEMKDGKVTRIFKRISKQDESPQQNE